MSIESMSTRTLGLILMGVGIAMIVTAVLVTISFTSGDVLPAGSEVVVYHWGGGTTTLTADRIDYNQRTQTVRYFQWGQVVGQARLLGRDYGYVIYCPSDGNDAKLSSILFELAGESADYHERTARRSLAVAERHMELRKGWNDEQ